MRCSVTFELDGKLHDPAVKTFFWITVTEAGLGGWVSDTEDGVRLCLRGEDASIGNYIRKLPGALPHIFSLSAIRLAEKQPLEQNFDNEVFQILSQNQNPEIPEADRAPCPDCVRKMLDPDSRFYHYPFTSCRNCGPRYSIGELSPFRRMSSAYLAFPPCRNCTDEVKKSEENPGKGNPIQACPFCGPSAYLMGCDNSMLDTYLPLESAGEMIDKGKILGVKTYDGFILLCNALLPDSVREMRNRKKMPRKPVSVMARDLDTVRKYCDISPAEEALISSPAAPVVIVKLRPDAALDSSLFCPDYPKTVGISLAPTAMLRLLFENRPSPEDLHTEFELFAFVGAPRSIDPSDAGGDDDFHAAAQFADAMLVHDLKIWQNGGSSVISVRRDGVKLIHRRSRGIAPLPIKLAFPLKRNVLALGCDRAAGVALGFGNSICVSQHMGAIGNTYNARSLTLIAERLMMLCAKVPDSIVCDMDLQNNLSANEALHFSEKYHIPLATAQRHHAQAVACMVEHGLTDALALVFDGGAFGPDGSVWGAEAMLCSLTGFKRLASFAPQTAPMCMPGSFPDPRMLLVSFMDRSGLPLPDSLLARMHLTKEELEVKRQERASARTVKSHAALNLFYAVSAAVGVAPQKISYDPELMVILEAMTADSAVTDKIRSLAEHFPFTFGKDDELPVVSWEPTYRSLSEPGWMNDYTAQELVLAFLYSAANAIFRMAELVSGDQKNIVLTGRLFALQVLSMLVENLLREKGYSVFIQEQSSPDETSVCIGQAVFGGMS